MTTNLANVLRGLSAMLLIAVLVLQIKQQGRLDALQVQQDTFPFAVSDGQQEQQDAAAKMANQLTTFGASLESWLTQSKQHTEAVQEHTVAMSDQVSAWKIGVTDMRQQLDDLVIAGALFPNKSKPAAEAVVLAKAAAQAGDTILARIYYLSAVNHAPSEVSILNSYAELVLRDPSATTEDLARLKSVLQLSMYQISPGNITNALALLSQVVNREEQLLAELTPNPVPVDWGKRFAEILRNFPLDAAWKDLQQMSKRWEALSEMVMSLREEHPDTSLLQRVEGELDLTQRVLTALRLSAALDTIMKALDSSSGSPEKAVSLLQTAEATVGQVWGIDSDGWPAGLRSKVDQYPMNIQNHVHAVAKVKSQPFLKIIEDERQSAIGIVRNTMGTSSDPGGGLYQKIVKDCERSLAKALAAAQSVSWIEGRKQVDADISEIQGALAAARRKQFDAYQKWVLRRCQQAFDLWKNEIHVTQRESQQFIEKATLMAVDQNVLSPEVSRAFNDVLAKLTAEMDGKAIFAVQKGCAEATKVKLEDF
jgi:hypothetical protein